MFRCRFEISARNLTVPDVWTRNADVLVEIIKIYGKGSQVLDYESRRGQAGEHGEGSGATIWCRSARPRLRSRSPETGRRCRSTIREYLHFPPFAPEIARNQAARAGVQADMKKAWRVAAGVAVGVSILAGCSGQPGGQTVTGMLVRVGGPAGQSGPPPPLPLPGTIVARNAAGQQFTATAGNDGRFELSLPPGRYWLTGHSPQVWVNNQQMLCSAQGAIQVTKRRPVRKVWVICSIM